MAVWADRELARRIEEGLAAELGRFVGVARGLYPESDPALLEVSGGVAAFLETDSPLNRAAGLGVDVAVADYEIVELERFFAERGSVALSAVCPLAHPSLFEVFARRGWVVAGFENVLVRELEGVNAASVVEAAEPIWADRTAGDRTGMQPASGRIAIEPVTTTRDRELWASIAARAFCAPTPPPAAHVRLAEICSAMPDTMLFVARVDGQPAGTGELLLDDELAWLSADSTLPAFRRMGVQGALQRHRLQLAADSGARIAVSETAPGSDSQRNMQRLGFEVAYTRIELMAPHAGGTRNRTG